MNIIRAHVDKDHVEAFQLFVYPHKFHWERINLPEGDALFLIVPAAPANRQEVKRQPGVTLLPGANSPGTVGHEHAARFKHVDGVHHAMTPHDFLLALHTHPEHPHHLLDPEA